MKREEIFEYVNKQYGSIPEYLWRSSPESAILRHKNGKWYAAILRVEKGSAPAIRAPLLFREQRIAGVVVC